MTAEVIDLAERIGDKELSIRGRAFRLIELLEKGDIAEADEQYRSVERLADETRQPIYRYISDLFRAGVALREGRFADAEEILPSVREWAYRQGRVTAVTATDGQSLWLGTATGRSVDEPAVDVLLAFSQAAPKLSVFAASVYERLGRDADARAHWEKVVAEGVTDLPRDWSRLPAACFAAGLASAYDDGGSALELYRLLEPYRDRVLAVGATAIVLTDGTVANALARLCTTLERPEEAERRFVEALALNQRMRAWPWVAQTRVEYAGFLLGRGGLGDRDRAVALLDTAIEDAERMGMAPLVEQARSLRAAASR